MKKAGVIVLGATAIGTVIALEYLRRTGKLGKIKGETKRIVGSFTDNKKLEIEGLLELNKARVREAVSSVKEITNDTIDNIKEAIRED